MAYTSISTSPTGAELYVNNKLVATTPYGAEWFKAGDSIKITKSGYNTISFTLSSPQVGTSLSFTLTKSEAPAPLPAGVDIYPYVFVKPGPKFTDSDSVKFNYAEMSAVSVSLEDYPEGNEMLGFIAYFTGPLTNTSPINVRGSFYNDATGTLLYSGEYNVPTPASQGWDYWTWYKVKFWIGHASWEINKAMKVRMEIRISGGGFPTATKTLYQEVTSKLPPPVELRIIEGYVKNALGIPLGLATITFGSKYTQSRSTDGYYGLIDPDFISGPIECKLAGYETQTKMITAPETGRMTINWTLEAAVLPPPEIPWYEDLAKAAVFLATSSHPIINTAFEVLLKLPNADDLLTALGMYGFDRLVKEAPEYEVLRKSPRGSVSIAVILGIITLIMGIGTVVGWLRKELPEPTGMAVWAAIEAEEWQAASKANEQYKTFIDKTNWWLPTIVSWFNPFLAWMININTKSQIAQYEAYKKIIDGHLVLKKGTLVITPTPADSKVSVSGQIPTTGEFNAELDVGVYRVVVSKFGYVSESYDAEVREGEESAYKTILKEEVKPPALKAKLVIDVTPDAALVIVAGHPEITKEGDYFLDPGSYTIDFSLEGYEPTRRTVFLKEAEVEIVSVILKAVTIPPPPEEVIKEGALNLAVKPFDAIIEVAGRPEIKMSGIYVLPEGSYSIKVSKEGYESQTRTALIKEGVTTTISISLTELPPPAEELAAITIKSEPTNTDIYIDGKYTFTKTPYTAKLEAGTYIIRCQTSGYYPNEVQIEVSAGEVGEITLALAKIPQPEVPVEPYVPWEYYIPAYTPPAAPQVQVQPAPYLDLPVPAYNYLDPSVYFYEPALDVQAPYTKELIVNVETTDVLPFKGRITSIAFLDLTDPEQMPKVITSDDEEDVLNTFLDYFDAGGFTKIIGFNVSFDHRFIFTKAALYRRQCSRWAKIEMRDIMQILQQVQEKFVYSLNKAGTLDDWGKHLLGVGKYGTQEEVLARFIRKDFEYVDAFNLRQIELVRDLYALLRYTLSEASLAAIEASQSTISPEAVSEYPLTSSLPQKKKCPNCLQENPIENTECFVCGASI